MRLQIQPIDFREACAFVAAHHRHHRPPAGMKFAVACNDGDKIVGVAIIGRPIARHLDDSWTLEVTRLCTDGTKNACSFLYGAAARAARALGYKRIITYTLITESGESLRGSGWRAIWTTKDGQSWNTPARPRIDSHPLDSKQRWLKELS